VAKEIKQKSSLIKDNKRVLKNSILIVLFMFGFGFALVPIYNTICNWLGTNGQAKKYDGIALSQIKVDKSRTVLVEFFSDVNSNLDWEFHTTTGRVEVHPGKQTRIVYVAKNNSDKELTGLAKFNISPPEAGRYFNKTECFCFTQQTLAAGEIKRMPLVFMVDPKLPKRIKNIVLTYEFIGTKKKVAKNSAVSQ